MKERLRATALLLMCFVMIGAAGGQEIRVTVEAGSAGKPISGKLFGIFFEDLNYAADGGLYAEMVQNRSFEYSSRDVPGWHAFTGWEVVQRDGGRRVIISGMYVRFIRTTLSISNCTARQPGRAAVRAYPIRVLAGWL